MISRFLFSNGPPGDTDMRRKSFLDHSEDDISAAAFDPLSRFPPRSDFRCYIQVHATSVQNETISNDLSWER